MCLMSPYYYLSACLITLFITGCKNDDGGSSTQTPPHPSTTASADLSHLSEPLAGKTVRVGHEDVVFLDPSAVWLYSQKVPAGSPYGYVRFGSLRTYTKIVTSLLYKQDNKSVASFEPYGPNPEKLHDLLEKKLKDATSGGKLIAMKPGAESGTLDVDYYNSQMIVLDLPKTATKGDLLEYLSQREEQGKITACKHLVRPYLVEIADVLPQEIRFCATIPNSTDFSCIKSKTIKQSKNVVNLTAPKNLGTLEKNEGGTYFEPSNEHFGDILKQAELPQQLWVSVEANDRGTSKLSRLLNTTIDIPQDCYSVVQSKISITGEFRITRHCGFKNERGSVPQIAILVETRCQKTP